MNCPKCSREIADNSLFCGYCGATIEQTAENAIGSDSAMSTLHGVDDNIKKVGEARDSPSLVSYQSPESPKKKKSFGFKIFLVFSFLAVIAGSTLGFVFARGIVDWRAYLPTDKFMWTDISEGILPIEDASDIVEDSKEKEELSSPTEEPETQAFSESEDNVP